MIHLPPFGLIQSGAKRVYWWLKGKFFGKTIYTSHKRWLQQTGLGSRWDDIGEDIEYSLSMGRWPEGPEESKIAFRTKNGRQFDSITFVVEASGDKFDYDATVMISSVSERPRNTTLAGFPVYRLYAFEGSIYSTYSDFTVCITEVTENGVSRKVDLDTLSMGLGDQTMANPRDWKFWAGRPVNIAVIRREQEALKKRLWYKLGHPQLGFGNGYTGIERILYPLWLRRFPTLLYEHSFG